MRRIARTPLARLGATAVCLLAYRIELYPLALACGVAAFYAWTAR